MDELNSNDNLQSDAPEESALELGYVVFILDKDAYAVPAVHVLEMVQLLRVTELPEMPHSMRGVMKLRDEVLPLMDMRLRVGKPGLREETEKLIAMFSQREQDHVNWLEELQASVEEERPFQLTTDPHECAFGKWYDAYETDNQHFRSHLRRFNKPHRKIHAIAQQVEKLKRESRHEEARQIINRTRQNELDVMKKLFADAKEFLKNDDREIATICDVDGLKVGLIVDSVQEVREIDPNEITSGSAYAEIVAVPYVKGVANLDGTLCKVLDLGALIRSDDLDQWQQA